MGGRGEGGTGTADAATTHRDFKERIGARFSAITTTSGDVLSLLTTCVLCGA